MIDGIIYKAVNRVSRKIYVGQTIHSLRNRIAAHFAWAKKRDGKRLYYFHAALKKYGEGSFSWSGIDRARTKKALDRKERGWIRKLNCKAPNGYNSTDGGEDNPMNHPEIAAKISGENNPMKRPEVAAKFSGENNPMKRPEVAAKIRGENNGLWKGGTGVTKGCLLILRPDHSRADHLGYVCAHFLEWEKRRGPIPPGKSVCFKDKTLRMIDRYGRRYKDPRISNLYIPGI